MQHANTQNKLKLQSINSKQVGGWRCGWVGGMAQWLGRRSMTGGLSLICAWSIIIIYLLRQVAAENKT